MTSKEVIQSVWDCNNDQKTENIHKQCSVAVENILRDSLNKKTLDNVTVVMIAFNNYKIKLFGNNDKQPLEERINFQQPIINSAQYLSHGNKIDHSSILNQGSKTATASSSLNYNSNFNNYFDKDIRKSLNITPANKNNGGDQNLKKKFKENQFKNGIEYTLNNSGNINMNTLTQNKQVQSSSTIQSELSNTNSSNSMNSQYNKYKYIDLKISDISSKVHQFSTIEKKLTNNNR